MFDIGRSGDIKKVREKMDKDYEHLLNELLAIIHRDGGHYVQEHGIEKAVEDAINIINKERAVITYHRQRAGGGGDK